MKKYKSVVYVNFSPYENTGNILDYILKSFEQAFVFSFDFHALNNKRSSKLRVYSKNKIIYEKRLFTFPLSEELIFLLLPLRSVLILFQVFWHLLFLRKIINRPVTYFTINGFTAWVGNLLKKIGLVDKTIFWVWDYYPPGHPSLIIRLMRKLYWYFDNVSVHSDKLVFLNNRLAQLRKNIGVLPSSINYSIVPIGTNPINVKFKKKEKSLNLAFIGVLKRTQGLDRIFDYDKELTRKYKTTALHVIGSGPDEEHFKKRAEKSLINTIFYGLLSEQRKDEAKKIIKILSGCDIGVALYLPEKSNLSYYGDPSKVKKYLSIGLPTITTAVYEFSRDFKKGNAGVLVNYYSNKEFIQAIERIMRSAGKYRRNALNLANKYHYKKIYPELFDFND